MSELEAAPKRPAPFSVRLSPEERTRLEDEAEGVRLGTYIKVKLLDGAPAKRATAIADRPSLAQALALLGQSRFASNLNQITHLAHIGALTFTPEEQAELSAALRHVAEIRSLLLSALGKKTGDLS
jgi:hypothetical protein